MATLGGWFAQRGADLAKAQQPQQGSLAALGGGQQPPMTGIDWDQHMIGTRPGEPGFDPNKGFNPILYPGGQLPPGWQPPGGMHAGSDLEMRQPGWDQGIPIPGGNRGSGQPINQPMGPPIGYAEKPEDYQRRLASVGQQNPMLMPAGTGSLQSLGGWQLNQSGMVNLRGPDGSTKAVPQSDLAHWLSKGAQQIQGAF